MRIHDYSSPWILADTLCNSMLLLLILFGMGMFQVYNVLKSELEKERVITLELERYIYPAGPAAAYQVPARMPEPEYHFNG